MHVHVCVCVCAWEAEEQRACMTRRVFAHVYRVADICVLSDHFFLVERKGEDSYTVLTGKGINQSKPPKDLSELSIGDTVVAKWGTKDFEAVILKVGRLLLLMTVS